jgi:hypothetical protein
MKTYITLAQDKKTYEYREFHHKSTGAIQATKDGRSIVRQENNLKYLTTKISK